jgi:hypothetical protein
VEIHAKTATHETLIACAEKGVGKKVEQTLEIHAKTAIWAT